MKEMRIERPEGLGIRKGGGAIEAATNLRCLRSLNGQRERAGGKVLGPHELYWKIAWLSPT